MVRAVSRLDGPDAAQRGVTLARRYVLVAAEPDVGLFDTWRAEDLDADRRAVRVERVPSARDAAAFDAGVQRLRALSDLGLARVLDGGRSDDGAWVVTEHVEGRALSHWLAGHRGARTLPSLGAAQRLFEKVAGAARFLHEVQGLAPPAHGAICARNVLVRRVGAQHAVKVLGAGLLHPSAEDGASTAWQRALPYLAPERVAAGAASQPADVFALGVLMVALLTTRATPESMTEPWCAYVQSPGARVRERLATLRDDVPPGVWDVIAQALAPAARDRPAGAAQLARALRDAWTAAGAWSTPPTHEQEPPPPAPESPDGARDARRAEPARDAALPVGWQEAERPLPVSPPPAAQPAAQSWTLPPRAEVAEPPPRPRTAHIDLATHSDFLAQSSAHDAESTRAIDLPRRGDDLFDEHVDPTTAIDMPENEDSDDEATHATGRPPELDAPLRTEQISLPAGLATKRGAGLTLAPTDALMPDVHGDEHAVTERVGAREVHDARRAVTASPKPEAPAAEAAHAPKTTLAAKPAHAPKPEAPVTKPPRVAPPARVEAPDEATPTWLLAVAVALVAVLVALGMYALAQHP